MAAVAETKRRRKIMHITCRHLPMKMPTTWSNAKCNDRYLLLCRITKLITPLLVCCYVSVLCVIVEKEYQFENSVELNSPGRFFLCRYSSPCSIDLSLRTNCFRFVRSENQHRNRCRKICRLFDWLAISVAPIGKVYVYRPHANNNFLPWPIYFAWVFYPSSSSFRDWPVSVPLFPVCVFFSVVFSFAKCCLLYLCVSSVFVANPGAATATRQGGL